MTVKRITLNTEKTTPIYEYPITLRQGDTSIQIPVDLEEDFSEKDLTKTKLEFYSDKPDATTIEDDEQSHFQIGADKKSFTYTFPDELTDASGSTTNTYFKIGNDSTSNFYIHILTKAGMEKLESGDYISKVDRIFNHVMSDYTAINDLAETGKGTFDTALADSKKEIKDLMDNLNAEYVQFINSKTTDFNTFLANLDSQATDVKTKYTALKAQLDALEVPEIGGRNYLLDSENYNKSYWLRNIGIFGDVLNDSFNGTKIVQTNVNWGGPKYSVDNLKERGLLDDTSQSWIFSAYARTTTNVTAEINFFGLDSAIDAGTVGQNWKRISVTFKFLNPNSTISFSPIELDKVPATIQFACYKLEKGTIPTDWTPAPKDKANVSDTNDLQNKYAALQTQVDNSAVGTNLLTNTGDLSANWIRTFTISTTTEYDGHPSAVFTPSTQLANHNLDLGKLQNSTKYTASFWAKADNAGDKAHTELGGSIGATDFVLTTDWVRYTAVLTSRSDASTNISHSVYFFGVIAGNKGNVYIAEPKLEKGNVATDYCPNPSEILTQSDYKKIQAAIVALGGSLS